MQLNQSQDIQIPMLKDSTQLRQGLNSATKQMSGMMNGQGAGGSKRKLPVGILDLHMHEIYKQFDELVDSTDGFRSQLASNSNLPQECIDALDGRDLRMLLMACLRQEMQG